MAELNAIDSSKTIASPFFAIDGDDRFRPFTTAIVPHDPTAATIILTQRRSDKSNNVPAVVDYFTNFKNKVDPLLPDITKDRTGEIVDLKEVSGGNGGKLYGVFRNFSLIRYNEVREEIAKVALNFGAKFNAYFFGQKPRVYNFGGFFIDSKNYPYYEQFMKAYDKYLAGGKCVSGGFRLYMAYDGKITSGWMLGINTEASADNLHAKTFSFQLLVDDESWFRVNYEYDVDFKQISGNGMSNLYQIPELSKR